MTSQRLNILKKLLGCLIALPIFIMSSLFISPLPVQALADIYKPVEFVPQVSVPNSEFTSQQPTNVSLPSKDGSELVSDLLPRYIKAFYNYGLAIVGILAAIVLMGGGVIWLTSGGDAGKVSQAKELITGSIIGTILLLCSWIILNTINPELLNFKPISTDIITNPGCCEIGNQAIMTNNKKECVSQGGSFIENSLDYNVTVANNRCLKSTVYCVKRTDCQGKIASCYETNVSSKPSFMENCGTAIKENWQNLAIITTGRCEKDGASDCSGKKSSCTGVQDGKPCGDDSIDSYCYEGLCQIGFAKESERCGIMPGAFCSIKDCGELTGNSYLRDTYNDGRRCAVTSTAYGQKKMNCCYKASDAVPGAKTVNSPWGKTCGNEGGTCWLPGGACPTGFNRDFGGSNCNPGRCCKAKK